MPLFVHLAPTNAVPRIRRAGIKCGRWGVFCMPMLADYYSTHQWTRELKRRGHRRMLAISFWLSDDEPVEVGHYGAPHETMPASAAVKTLMEAEDRLGYEVIVPHAIRPRDIRAVRPIPHVGAGATTRRRMANQRSASATGAAVARSSASALGAIRRNGCDGAPWESSSREDEEPWASWLLNVYGSIWIHLALVGALDAGMIIAISPPQTS